MAIATVNPVNGSVIKTFNELSRSEVKAALGVADHAYRTWKTTTFEERGALFVRLAEVLRSDAKRLAELITVEMGKPINQSFSEIEKCAWVCEYYAEHAEAGLAQEMVKTDGNKSYVRYEPLGVLLAVMPWNFPFWQVLRWAAPSLMAGNVGVLKHASNVPQCALAIEECFEKAGFEVGVFQTLLIGSEAVEEVLRNDLVKGVALTGSERAGGIVAGVAGNEIKPSVMELGGSDPMIILDDADLARSCEIGTASRMLSGGQCCISAKRFIVLEHIAADFLTELQTSFERLVVGDPMDEKTDVGPLASKQILDDIQKQVASSVASGAKLVCGGHPIGGDGFFYEPTILTNITPEMSVYHEETFGPVATVIVVKNITEAIAVANDTRFGLGASVWTEDISKAEEIAMQLEAGAVFINGMVKSDPRLPFGGIKKSGYGRELGVWGLRSFVNVKSVWIA